MPTLEKPVTTRPAIPHDPLPQAADSLYDELHDQVYGKAMFWLITVLVVGGVTALEWYRYFVPIKSTFASNIVLSILALAFIAFAIIKARRALRQTRILKLGIRGEIHVGQYLDQTCPPLGYRVFHDIPALGSGGPFNIDHALIGPGGIFSIETKNWTLPPSSRGRATIIVDGDILRKSDDTFDAAAVRQAKANADYLRQTIARLTARPEKSLPSKPVLILPGWWIEDSTPSPRPIWIVNNKALHQWLPNERRTLSPDEIAMLSETLTTHIRNFKP